jgi:hypothetical protein
VRVAIDNPSPGDYRVVHLARAVPLAMIGGPSAFQLNHIRRAAKAAQGNVPMIGGEDLSQELGNMFTH